MFLKGMFLEGIVFNFLSSRILGSGSYSSATPPFFRCGVRNRETRVVLKVLLNRTVVWNPK